MCNVLGGGRASAMALQKEHAHMKLIPWAGVAGRIASVLGGGGEDAQVGPMHGTAGSSMHANSVHRCQPGLVSCGRPHRHQ